MHDRDETLQSALKALKQNSALNSRLRKTIKEEGELKRVEGEIWVDRTERKDGKESKRSTAHEMGSRFCFLPCGDRQPYRRESPYTAAMCKRRKGETRGGRKKRRRKKKMMMKKMGWCIDASRSAQWGKGGWKDRAMGRRGGG